MCKSHKMLYLCGCFLRSLDIELCNSALARLNCVVDDVIDLAWTYCADYPNCEVVIAGGVDLLHQSRQAVRSSRVQFADGVSGADSGAEGQERRGDDGGRDTGAGMQKRVDQEVEKEGESEEK